MRYTPLLCTRDYLRAHRGLSDSETADDDLLYTCIEEASGDFITATGRTPHPFEDTRLSDFTNSLELVLDEDLLAITTLTNGDSTTISSTNYVLKPANEYPKRRIIIKSSAGSVYFTYNDAPEQCISVEGIWGYAPHYPTCWKAITTINGSLTDSVTTITVASGSGVEVGGYLLIGSEQLLVTGGGAKVWYVERGANGTTAAAHSNGAGVSIYRQLPDIAGAVCELAKYYYLTRNRTGGRVQVFDGGAVTVEDLDPRVMKAVKRHSRVGIIGVG